MSWPSEVSAGEEPNLGRYDVDPRCVKYIQPELTSMWVLHMDIIMCIQHKAASARHFI
jgi:hypothetical protein